MPHNPRHNKHNKYSNQELLKHFFQNVLNTEKKGRMLKTMQKEKIQNLKMI